MVGDVKELKLEQDTYKGKDNKIYPDYFSYVTIRGMKKKLHFKAVQDVMDLLFYDNSEVKVTIEAKTFPDEKTNRLIEFYECQAYSVDSDGKKYTYKVKPKFDSDRAILDMYMNF